jgi:nitrite reductase (NADH) small subunit
MAQGADEGRIATYPVRLEGGRILLDAAAVGRRSAA